ncbi:MULTISPECIES: isochorismatase family protein [unclassified Streptomyces]|uniref:isochorismatase family protein n=1 Tax=Streptomycetaceae TaxID=2062 RepID=UPI002E78C3BC|nr:MULTISPECIES: isochorismatase family protein [unclassified Streptomyces]MED7952352.1 isochorismatase family protein [Streptomyces sp. BE303]MEE1826263.1 isochorismatase family protein [Streptomyces sp. BE20]
MALPAIAPYELPGPADLPPRKVPWQVDPARAAVLVHDLQNYFLGAFPAEGPPLAPALANTARILEWARTLGMPVIYSHQRGGQTPEERGLQLDFWGPGLPADEQAQGVPAVVAPAGQDVMLLKWKYSAFARTELAGLLEKSGRDQLVIVGVYAHIGVMMTAADAWSRDVQAFVVGDAVADFSAEKHTEALRWAAEKCAVVLSTADLLEEK